MDGCCINAVSFLLAIIIIPMIVTKTDLKEYLNKDFEAFGFQHVSVQPQIS